ncbi:PREDICTED: uncharacterized protein LOC109474160 isoform X2 [Branchiostoma belcheri]|uniref:Uncharacterized protein LOC109474160 isoform X2 n=1 Tax=Branchiostoma belcheri TaxID=7741 RepID=A0A6P4ZK02_BRABE|nr:PREDICTED: uncharacterized protein LOC109474160 isoform X2 [Branchiostoma belcheri]
MEEELPSSSSVDHAEGAQDVPKRKRRKRESYIWEYKQQKLQRIHERVDKLTSGPAPPSCVFFYMDYGSKQIKSTGPSHMKEFLQDRTILEKFERLSANRPTKLRPSGPTAMETIPEQEEEKANDVSLQQIDPHQISVANLRRIISSIAKGNRNFWTHENRPGWWPDELPFASPSAPCIMGGKERKLRLPELIKLLSAYQMYLRAKSSALPASDSHGQSSALPASDSHGQSSALPASDSHGQSSALPASDSHGQSSALPASDSRGQSSALPASDSRGQSSALPASDSHGQSSATINQEPKAALQRLAKIKDWDTFQKCCRDIDEHIQLPQLQYATFESASQKKTGYTNIPVNHVALETTGDGDCLFNAVSIALTGSEEHAATFRLGAAAYGGMHADHLIEQYIADGISNVGSAQMLLHSVCTEDTANACSAVSPREIVEYAIKEEAKATSKMGSYSGLMQTSFLSGFCKHIITLHCQDASITWYDNRPMSPCGCVDFDVIGEVKVMLVRRTELSQLNHFVALIRSSGRVSRREERPPIPRLPGIEAESACVATLGMGCAVKRYWEKQMMVQCDRCKSWSHNRCIPVPEREEWEALPFCCCAEDKRKAFHNTPNITLLNNLATYKGSPWRVLVKLADVVSLKPTYWLTSSLVDFYGRHLAYAKAQNEEAFGEDTTINFKILPSTFILQLERDIARQKSPSAVHKSYVKDMQGIQFIIIPICRENHWWLLCITEPNDHKRTCLLVLDSLAPGPAHHREIDAIKRYLSAVTKENCTSVAVLNVKVPPQENGNDCGPHILYNMEWIVENQPSCMENLVIPRPEENIGIFMRRKIRKTLFMYFKFNEAIPMSA